MLVAMEYVAIVWLRPDSFQASFGSEIIDFAISADGEIGAFVLADNGEMAKHEIRRHRIEFIDMRRGKLDGELLTLPLMPKRVLPRDGQSGFFVGCSDGSIVYADCRSEASEPIRSFIQTDRALIQTNRTVVNLVYARERKSVIIRDLDSISARQADTGELLWQRRFEKDLCVAVDDFGKWLYCGLNSGEVLQINAASGQTERVCAQHDTGAVRLTVSPCGEFLASVLTQGQLVMTRLVDGKAVWTGRTSPNCKPAFSIDGKRLVIVDDTRQSRLLVINARSGVQLFVLGKHERVVGIRCAPDGNVYSWGYDGGIIAWSLDSRQKRWQSHPARMQDRQQGVLATAGAHIK